MDENLFRSLRELSDAIEYLEKERRGGQSRLPFLAVAKAFEVSIEYFWKHLKYLLVEMGLDPNSPKMVLRESAKNGLIKDPEIFLEFIKIRNLGVHDYYGLSEKEYVAKAKDYFLRAEGFLRKT